MTVWDTGCGWGWRVKTERHIKDMGREGKCMSEAEVLWEEWKKFQGEGGLDRRVGRQVDKWLNTRRDTCAHTYTN